MVLAPSRIFSSPDKSELHFLALKGWYSVAVDQGDLTSWMIDHSVDTCRGDKVTGVYDEVLH